MRRQQLHRNAASKLCCHNHLAKTEHFLQPVHQANEVENEAVGYSLPAPASPEPTNSAH
jgi:hypothetical protein